MSEDSLNYMYLIAFTNIKLNIILYVMQLLN